MKSPYFGSDTSLGVFGVGGSSGPGSLPSASVSNGTGGVRLEFLLGVDEFIVIL